MLLFKNLINQTGCYFHRHDPIVFFWHPTWFLALCSNARCSLEAQNVNSDGSFFPVVIKLLHRAERTNSWRNFVSVPRNQQSLNIIPTVAAWSQSTLNVGKIRKSVKHVSSNFAKILFPGYHRWRSESRFHRRIASTHLSSMDAWTNSNPNKTSAAHTLIHMFWNYVRTYCQDDTDCQVFSSCLTFTSVVPEPQNSTTVACIFTALKAFERPLLHEVWWISAKPS